MRMKNQLLSFNRLVTYLLVMLCAISTYSALANTTKLASNVLPPGFLQSEPADTTVACVDDFPPPLDLPVEDDDASVTMVTSQDNIDVDTLNRCNGGVVTRTWEFTSMSNEIFILSQTITIAPDTVGPVVGPALMNSSILNDTVSCEIIDFALWLGSVENTIELFFNSNNPDCNPPMGGFSAVYSGPGTFSDNCGTVNATFSVSDSCGNATIIPVTYTVLDTIAPKLVGVPNDTILNCNEAIPAVAMGVSASDNCVLMPMVTFREDSTRVLDGSCAEFEYELYRIWEVSDGCGNVTIDTQIIFVEEMGIDFDVPADLELDCEEDITDLMITGMPTNIMEVCTPFDTMFYQDNVIDGTCPQFQEVQRIWTVQTECASLTKLQTITLIDTVPPVFMVPPDTTINCEHKDNLMVTGEPALVSECSSLDTTYFFDLILQGSCPTEDTIRRNWIMADLCGNADTMIQQIIVIDTVPPTLLTLAMDTTIFCGTNVDIQGEFSAWIAANGGATASDTCIAPEFLTWTAYNAGTMDPASLMKDTVLTDSVNLIQRVMFIVADECGNEDTTRATFTVIDTIPPIIQQCALDTTLCTDPGECFATYTFFPPLIEENCGTSIDSLMLMASAGFTTSGPGNLDDIPVDPIVLDIPVGHALPINAFGDGTLEISLIQADSENADEFFNIFGEDGVFIGTTAHAMNQCMDSDTSFLLSVMQLNAWGADGTISLRLEPNLPADPEFAINNICGPDSRVEAKITFATKSFDGLMLEYSVNGGARTPINASTATSIQVDKGVSRIQYFVTDCVGRVDSCSYEVTVLDKEPPVITCPADVVVTLAEGECTAMVTLPLPLGATDNCEVGNQFSQTFPADTASAYLTFTIDPNLTTYQADDKTFQFTGVAANAVGPVSITLDLLGDFSSPGAFYTIIGENGDTIGMTSVGVADCMNPGQQTFTISDALFNAWAADGSVTIQAIGNEVPVPPGAPGDGIDPCSLINLTGNGDSDEQSYVFATLSYFELAPLYFVDGITDSLTALVPPAISPEFEFEIGSTDVYYVIADSMDNRDTCMFQVIVQDVEPPVAVCQANTIFINPSGLVTDTLQVSDIDAGSFDNCFIDTMYLDRTVFDCLDAFSSPQNVTLTVIDTDGNMDSCTIPVRIETEAPEPTSNQTICTNDTLFLFANPPAAPGGVVYTYKWFKDDIQISTQENPIILNAGLEDSGTYRVEIEGITGCTAEGFVNVDITDVPMPGILANSSSCADENIQLTATGSFPQGNITFMWYSGDQPNTTLIGTSEFPTFEVVGPHAEGISRYSVVVSVDGCTSPSSLPADVEITERPVAIVDGPLAIVLCEGDDLNLGGTIMAGLDITYSWTGPNNYESDAQFPRVVTNVTPQDAGVFTFILTENGCESAPVFITVTVLPKPETPAIVTDSPACVGEGIDFSATDIGTNLYEWSGPNGQSNLTGTNSFSIAAASVQDSGLWQVIGVQTYPDFSLECRSETSAGTNVIVNRIPSAIISTNPTNGAVCEGDQLELFATSNIAGTDFTWTFPNASTSGTDNVVIDPVTLSDEGIYRLTAISPAGCANVTSRDIDILEGVSIIAVSNDAPDCLSGPTDIRLDVTTFPSDPDEDFSYRWENAAGDFISADSFAIIPNATAADNGLYNVVVTSGDGCVSELGTTLVDVSDPPMTPELTVVDPNPPSPEFCEGENIVLNATAYSGNVLYNWTTPNGQFQSNNPTLTIQNAELSDEGDYFVFVTIDGCDSRPSGSVFVTINPIPVVSVTSNSPVCEGEIIQLTANSSVVSGANYAWSGPSAFTSSVSNPTRPNANIALHEGSYEVVVTARGCSSVISSTDVFVAEAPDVPVANNNGPICIDEDGAALQLSVIPSSATPSATYTWLDQNMDTLINGTSGLNFNLTNFEGYEDGVSLFFVQARLGECVSDISLPTEAVLNIIPEIDAFAGDDINVCNDQSVELDATPPSIGMGEWTQIGDSSTVRIIEPNQADTPIADLVEGETYQFLWTLTNGACVDYASDSVLVNVVEEQMADAGQDQVRCALPSTELAAVPAGPNCVGTWSQLEGQEEFLEIRDENDPQSLVTGLRPGNTYFFTWTLECDCGTSEDVVKVLVSAPFPFAGPDTIVCNDDAFFELNAEEPAEGSLGQWSSPGNSTLTFADQSDPSTVVSNLAIGDNMVVWTLDNAVCGEASVDTMIITYKTNPVANPDNYPVPFQKQIEFDLFSNDELPDGTTFEIIDSTKNGSVTQLEDGTFIYEPSFNFFGTDELIYELCSDGCECSMATASFTVGEDISDLCGIPNIMTPNGDSFNDAFVIPCLFDTDAFPESEVIIFNQWGDEVFRSEKPYRNDWEGTFNGTNLPASTYFYIVDFGNGMKENGYILIEK